MPAGFPPLKPWQGRTLRPTDSPDSPVTLEICNATYYQLLLHLGAAGACRLPSDGCSNSGDMGSIRSASDREMWVGGPARCPGTQP